MNPIKKFAAVATIAGGALLTAVVPASAATAHDQVPCLSCVDTTRTAATSQPDTFPTPAALAALAGVVAAGGAGLVLRRRRNAAEAA
jgi:LPXTG-motif cell wall-anchored protein